MGFTVKLRIWIPSLTFEFPCAQTHTPHHGEAAASGNRANLKTNTLKESQEYHTPQRTEEVI